LSYVDAHLHLADPGYSGKVESVIEDADKHRISCLLSNAVDYSSSLETVTIAKRYEGRVLAAVGVHPWTATHAKDYELDKFQQLLTENAAYIKAIGEIGLDGKYTQNQEQKREQRKIFEFFLKLAETKRLPAIVHSRMAVDEVLEILPSYNIPRVLLHWYSGPSEKLNLIQDRHYLISMGPSVFYSGRIIKIARAADMNLILSETDGPVSHHGPFEGQETLPSFVVEVTRKLSELKSMDVDAVRDAIGSNFHRLIPYGMG
jgi:TatD DNase family protein